MTKRKQPTPQPLKRNAKKRVKRRLIKAEEDARLAGIIKTVPAGLLRSEVVEPSTQGEQPLPGLIGQAIRRGWQVPEEKKPALVDELTEIIEDRGSDDNPPNPMVKVMAFNALTKGDQLQWERDNPELAGKTKGKIEINNSNSVTVNDSYAIYQQLSEAAGRDEIEVEIESLSKAEAVEDAVVTGEHEDESGASVAAGGGPEAGGGQVD